jgi:hypothetical protein
MKEFDVHSLIRRSVILCEPDGGSVGCSHDFVFRGVQFDQAERADCNVSDEAAV